MPPPSITHACLQAEILGADGTTTLTVSGNGDVLEPHDGVMAIGSGGNFAMAAARALVTVPGRQRRGALVTPLLL